MQSSTRGTGYSSNGYEPKVMAALVYSPWLLLPFALAVRMALWPYPDTVQAKVQEKMR